MVDLASHWNTIFAAKDDPQLGWYEADLSQTFKLVDRVPGLAKPKWRIDIKASRSVCSDA